MTDWLIDKSALVRLGASPDAAGWASRIERGLVRITTVTRLEVGYSARSGADLRAGLQVGPGSGRVADLEPGDGGDPHQPALDPPRPLGRVRAR